MWPTISRRTISAYEIVAFGTANQALKAYERGRCDSYTSDVSHLYSDRLKLANPSEHVVLEKIISRQPLGPAVRRGDDQWLDIVKWTLFAMLDAEELGITQKNVDQMLDDRPELKQAFAADGNPGKRSRADERLGCADSQGSRQLRRGIRA